MRPRTTAKLNLDALRSYALRALSQRGLSVSELRRKLQLRAELPGDVATVSGTALDFCLVVTQRRNVADTDLRVEGELAEDWISVAQAFAGPPGPGRPPA